jgi:hypothetical protein
MSKKPLFMRFAICNMLIIKYNFSGNSGKMTFLDIFNVGRKIVPQPLQRAAGYAM